MLPEEVWHLAEGGDLPGLVWFRLGEDESGGWVCTELRIDATQPLTTSALRSIPLTQIIEKLLSRPLTDDDFGTGLDRSTGLRESYFDDLLLAKLPEADLRKLVVINAKRPTKVRAKARRGGSGPTEQDLRQFADAYRWALANQPRRPVAAAAERMSIAPATAHRWMKLISASEPSRSSRKDKSNG